MAVTEEAFEHRMRKIIFNYIHSKPGASFGAIQKFVDMNASTLKYHLDYLERSTKIFSKKDGRKRCYYCTESPGIELDPGTRTVLDELNKRQKRIYNLVKKTPGISQKAIINKLKLNQKTASYNLKRLIELGLVWKVKVGGKTGYEPVTKAKMKEEIMNRLMLRLYRNEIDQETFQAIKKRLDSLDQI